MTRREAERLMTHYERCGFKTAMTQTDGQDIGFAVYGERGVDLATVFDTDYGERLLPELVAKRMAA